MNGSFESATLLLGSNLGQRIENIEAACSMIGGRAGKIHTLSSWYEGSPWGFDRQPCFINRAVVIQTPLSAGSLLQELKRIETESGRVPSGKWMARILDIDILFYGSAIIATEHLTIPHPWISLRRFVLTPLSEIMPEFVHPQLNITIKTLLQQCPDQGRVVRVPVSIPGLA